MGAGRRIALNFHGLGAPRAGVEPGERPFWLAVGEFEGIVQRVAARPDRERFLFTFDDGNASDLIAAEVLARHGFAGRFYVLTGRMGHEHSLAADDLRRLRRDGMTIGLHGRDHLDWRTLDDAQFDAETIGARRELADLLGAPVDEVAVPFGAYDRRVIAHLCRQGFARILTSDRGAFRPHERIWARNTVRRDTAEQEPGHVLESDGSPITRLRRMGSRTVRRYIR